MPMSCTYDDRYDDRHDHARWERSMRVVSRLSRRPRTVISARRAQGVWFPAAQVQKVVRPRCIPGVASTGSGTLPTPHHYEGASMAQGTRSSSGPHSRTGHLRVRTPRNRATRATPGGRTR